MDKDSFITKLKEDLSEYIITLNNEEYISLAAFNNIAKENIINEAVIGVILKRSGLNEIEIDKEDIVYYLENEYEKNSIKYNPSSNILSLENI